MVAYGNLGGQPAGVVHASPYSIAVKACGKDVVGEVLDRIAGRAKQEGAFYVLEPAYKALVGGFVEDDFSGLLSRREHLVCCRFPHEGGVGQFAHKFGHVDRPALLYRFLHSGQAANVKAVQGASQFARRRRSTRHSVRVSQEAAEHTHHVIGGRFGR